MRSLILLMTTVIDLLIWVVIIWAVLSWLTAFNVINTNNRFVNTLQDTLGRITEPMLNPIRRIIPNLGGIDITPIILVLLLMFLRNLILELGGMLLYPA
jgi:YggT family protein